MEPSIKADASRVQFGVSGRVPMRADGSYLVRDNDRAYGDVFIRRIRAMGIRDRPISPRSPWQNLSLPQIISGRTDDAIQIGSGRR